MLERHGPIILNTGTHAFILETTIAYVYEIFCWKVNTTHLDCVLLGLLRRDPHSLSIIKLGHERPLTQTMFNFYLGYNRRRRLSSYCN